ncbi:hypothetical protein D3C80_1463160 [compost metagenome]
MQELVALAEHLGIEADALNKQINPLIRRELLAGLQITVEIETGDLDRLERGQHPGRGGFILCVVILKISDAPHPSNQQLLMCLHRAGVDQHLFYPEVSKLSLVHIVFVVERNADPVDDLVTPLLLDDRTYQPRFVAMHIVLAQDFLNRLDTGLNRRLIIRCAVLAQQVLQYIRRHDGVALNSFDQILAND